MIRNSNNTHQRIKKVLIKKNVEVLRFEMMLCSSAPHALIKNYFVLSAHDALSFPQVYQRASIQCGIRSHCFELHRSAMLFWDYENSDVQRIFRYLPTMMAIISLLGPSKCPDGYLTITENISKDVMSELLRLRASVVNAGVPFASPNMGLNNCSNSCYIDCVLHALFFDLNFAYVNDTIIKPSSVWGVDEDVYEKHVHGELVNIANFIRGKSGGHISCYNVTKLRSIFLQQRKCKLSQSFASHFQGDSMEFLSFILQMFEPRTAVAELTYIVNGGVSRVVKTIPLVMIDSFQLHDGFDLGSAASTLTDLPDGMTCLSTTISPTCLVFYVNRLSIGDNMKQIRNRSMIKVPTRVYRSLKLRAVIVHSGAHYTTYTCTVQQWFIYDDTASPMIKQLEVYPDIIDTHGVLYFYYK